jgi:hypothetical protein
MELEEEQGEGQKQGEKRGQETEKGEAGEQDVRMRRISISKEERHDCYTQHVNFDNLLFFSKFL